MNQPDKKLEEFTESLEGFKTLMAAVAQQTKQSRAMAKQIESDVISIMEKQLLIDKRLNRLDALAGFKLPLWKRLLGKKNHVTYPEPTAPAGMQGEDLPPIGGIGHE